MTGTLKKAVDEFLALESAGGIVLFGAAGFAMLAANSPFAADYFALWDLQFGVHLGSLGLEKPLLLWINDGLMAVFFFLVGLELKREVLDGELSRPSQIVLPGLAALGGMAAPAVLFAWTNWGSPGTLDGWAIPTATDIAFAVGVLALLGERVAPSLKIFLLTLAILDDLGAITIIAVYYTDHLSAAALALAALAALVLLALNLAGVARRSAYALVGIVLWGAVLKSGVHATLAGVVLALFVPLAPGRNGRSPLRSFEEDLHRWVAFGVLPLFAFANAGISFGGLALPSLLEPLPLGIAAGLFFGKQLGIFAAVAIAVAAGVARLPHGARWIEIYGVSLLCGIGFTMSLFIGTLAFDQSAPHGADVRLGVLSGSLAAALAGYLVLRFAGRGVTAAR
jgi:NhaA family Na+:H+ antiporter